MNRVRIAAFMIVGICRFGMVRPAIAMEDGACREDVKKLCGDVKPGSGAIGDCLKTHADGLSAGCKEHMVEGRKRMKEVQEACAADLKKFCANVTSGQGREFACLHAYEDKISAGCKEKMPKRGMGQGMHHGDKDHDDHGDKEHQDPVESTPPPAK